ncbi:MAG: hypothetical protein OXC00_00250 [Acidimicrobiaceae bacterium]|nr:hypothetical protein [Acidimicrobiaceae bacterium]
MFDLDAAAPNIMPSRYRQVSVAAVPSLKPQDLVARFTGREAYCRTRFVVARLDGDPERGALVELARDGSDELFSPAAGARVLASAEECGYVRDDAADPGIASHLARAALRCPDRRCVVVEGRYRHVSFLLNVQPVRVTVVDVVPPEPSKLADQVTRVLDYAEDLPPIALDERIVDSRALVTEPVPEGLIVPCRGGGIDIEGVAVSHLDERPSFAGSALLGCERSQQIHRWFYRVEAAKTIDWCPRRLIDADESVDGLVLSRCCMLEEGLERHGDTVMVPWGATLTEVHHALGALVGSRDGTWTLT